jgi:hypothetical protein
MVAVCMLFRCRAQPGFHKNGILQPILIYPNWINPN